LGPSGPVVPENFIRADSRDEAESAHHPAQCLQSSSCLGRLSPTVQVEASAGSREAISPASAQYRPDACTAPPAASWECSGVVGMDDLAVANLLGLSRIAQPETILRWHRAGFRAYWRWKSRGRPGRPRVSLELRDLIHQMSKENPLWDAPRIHGELLKLGFKIAESTVSKDMVQHRGPPSQT